MSYKIGVDGGGSKTECMLIDPRGQMVAAHVGTGSNPSILGPERAASVVTSALESLKAQAATHFAQTHERAADPATLISATLLCVAGHRDTWQEFARNLRGFGKVETTDDSRPVLELATGGQPGLVLHAGTGSFVAARGPDGSIHYAGGLGWRFGDPGSGYDLGRRAVSRGLLELQGWAPPSKLGAAVRGHAGLDASVNAGTVTRHYYQHTEPNRFIASLAPTILQLASEGDAVAREIAVDSAGELLELAVGVASKLFSAAVVPTLRVGLSGPLLIHPVVHESLTTRAPFGLAPISETPIEGVRRLLARM